MITKWWPQNMSLVLWIFRPFFGNGRKTSATIIWPSHNLWKILGKWSGSSRESSKIFCDHPNVKALHRKTHTPSFYYKTTALSKHNLKQTQVTLSLWELKLSGNQTLIETSDGVTPGGRCSSEILKRSLRGTKIRLCGRGLKYFPPLSGTNSRTTHSATVHSLIDELLIHGVNETKLKISLLSYLCCHICFGLMP